MEILGRHILTQIKSVGFEENIYYNTQNPIFNGGISCYNGNISSSTWTYNNQTNGYNYFYDNQNRLSSTYSIVNGEWGDYLYSDIFNYDRNGNITDLYRFDENDLVDVLDFTYNGNKITSISDYVANYIPSVNTKHYRNLLNDQTEFEYDRNGNMTKDLDRNICKIRYNVLNLPDIIQFGNGNQISHVYDAEGNRVKTTYYTRKSATPITTSTILCPEDSLSKYNFTSVFFDSNVRYNRYDNSNSLYVDYILNPEGYYRYYTSFDRYPFYYIRDHIGNICQTWIYPAENYKVCVQKMQYYPSGLTWNQQNGAIEHPFRYNGKELVEQFNLDEYDSKARWYYPAIMRTTTMDPLCEKYYDISPYAWCGNNMVRNVDYNGDDIYFFDEKGEFTGNIIKQEGEPLGRILFSDNIYIDFTFNDPADAERVCLPYSDMYLSLPGGMDNNAITHVSFIDEKQVNDVLSQVNFHSQNYLCALSYAFSQSRMGNMDFVNNPTLFLQTDPNALFLPMDRKNIVYNNFDFGNYLWGKSMYMLGIPLWISRLGAQIDNILHHGFHLDSKSDQRAIINGYNSVIKR